MRNLIWGLVFFLLQTWFQRFVGKQIKQTTTSSGITFMEAAERIVRRLLLFVFTTLAAGIAGLIGLYFVIQTIRQFLERDLGWDPAGVTAIFAVVFLGLGAFIISKAKPKSLIERSRNQLPASIGSSTALGN